MLEHIQRKSLCVASVERAKGERKDFKKNQGSSFYG
jgi:hypothetical protein